MSSETTEYCDCAPVVDATYDPERHREPSVAIVEALATAADTDPCALPPIGDSVDLDAVNQLLATRSEAAEATTVLRFAVDQWNVFVREDGRIRVCDRTAITEPKPVFGTMSAETIG